MNKILLSTAKAAVLFTVSTFFAYMILKTQIKHSSKKSGSKNIVKEKVTEFGNNNEGDTNPVLTYVASTKAETSDVSFDVDELEVTYFDSSKAGDFEDIDEIILSPSAFAKAEKKQYVKLEPDTLDENGKEIEQEFFHSSKAVLTTVAIENVKDDTPVYFPTSKSAPMDMDFLTEEEKFAKDEDTQIQIFQLEDQIRKLKAQIAALKKSLK